MKMTDKPTLLTAEGKIKLEEELDHLRDVKRPLVSERIGQAKEEGDLRENAEYDDAKREQGFVEGRIRELEYILKNVQIIEALHGATVGIGSTVTIREEGTSDDETYTVVGAMEANPSAGRISNESPLGRSLLGKRKGNKIHVTTPSGAIAFKVIKVG